jgi:hypothetical protein
MAEELLARDAWHASKLLGRQIQGKPATDTATCTIAVHVSSMTCIS